MKREERMKLREIQRQIRQLKSYEDNKFLKDKQRSRIIETLEYLNKQKEAIIFRYTIEDMIGGKSK